MDRIPGSPNRAGWIVALFWGLVGLSACGDSTDSSSGAGSGPEGTTPPPVSAEDEARLQAIREEARGKNVLLITLDTLRADRVGCYGHDGARTPTLDRLAREGVLAERAMATVPLTLPSHASMLTGQNPTTHGVRENTIFVAPPEMLSIAEVFRDQGYQTAAFVSTFILAEHYGLDQGFDHYAGAAEDFGGGVQQGSRRGAQTVNLALEWVESKPPEPWFLWVHMYDPHRPWNAPEPFASEIQDPYDAEIAYTDRQVQRLLRRYDVDGRLDRTLVILTSDHGEGMDEHDEASHGMFIYDTTMKVPLILRYPPLGAGKRLKGQVSLVDLAPTCADLFGLPGMNEMDGRSLLPALIQDQPEVWHDAYLETLMPEISYELASLAAVCSGHLKYIEAPRPELYDWSVDPQELNNQFLERPDDVDRMQQLLREIQGPDGASYETNVELSQDTIEMLAALGYVADGDSEGTPGGDPKDYVRVLEAQSVGLMLIESGQPENAVPILENIIENHPNSSLALAYLGQAYVSLRRWEDAIDPCQRAVALRPDRPRPLLNLALAYAGSSQPTEALTTYGELRKLHPAVIEGYLNPARIHAGQGQFDRALELLEMSREHAHHEQQRQEIDRRVQEVQAQREAAGSN